MTIGILHSTIRGDEKLIIEAAKRLNVAVKLIDIRTQILGGKNWSQNIDIAIERSVSTVKGTYAVEYLEQMGIPVINSAAVGRICQDKFLTSCVLQKNDVPTIPFGMVFSLEQAETLVENLGGFPIVMKPAKGSWGRLLAKINDQDSLEAMIDHKNVLGSPDQKAFYLQKFIDTKNRDIRAFVIGGKVICAIYRDSKHWITNTARGGIASNCKVNKNLRVICKKAANAVGGGILAMDVMETKFGYLINEINHTMEFKNSEKPTGVSISGAIVDYAINLIRV